MSNLLCIQAIFVPQGAEHRAVCRGLSRVTGFKPAVVAIPMGTKSVKRYLQQWQQHQLFLSQLQPRVLVVGLCGSMKSQYRIGTKVLYHDCVYPVEGSEPRIHSCDRHFTDLLYSHLEAKVALVKALTSDRLVHTATDKRYLAQTYNADVVDMEGFAALEVLNRAGVVVAMLRVVSDDCDRDIPDLTAALSPKGSLQPLPLALGMLRRPIAASRLIRGALQGLKVLEEVTTLLFEG